VNREIILSNFAQRPVRTVVSALAVAIEVALILLVIGLVNGIITETGERNAGVGADIMLQPPGSALFLGLSSAAMPVELERLIRENPEVEAVAPVVVQFNTQDTLETIFGIEPESFEAITGGFRFVEGEIFDSDDELVVDDIWAEAKQIDVGDTVDVLNHEFTIAGIVEHGQGARVYMDLAAAQEMTGRAGETSLFYIDIVDPDRVYEVIANLEQRFVDYSLVAMQDLVSAMMNANIPALDAFLSIVVGVSVVIGTLVIFLSMYTTISERTREIGILRSLGASRQFVVVLILEETLWLCAIGVVVGVAASLIGALAIPFFSPTVPILITTDWIAYATLLSVASGLLGAVYPAAHAASRDPVESLAYE
jgi:putative ABC transport system permease protein